MFVPYRERSVQVGMRVRVYRNLLKPNFFSIQAMEGPDKGKVVGYARAVGLENVRFVVSKKTWERVISEGVRTVFAFADGALVDCLEALPAGFDERITLQPFERCYFFQPTATGNSRHRSRARLSFRCRFLGRCRARRAGPFMGPAHPLGKEGASFRPRFDG